MWERTLVLLALAGDGLYRSGEGREGGRDGWEIKKTKNEGTGDLGCLARGMRDVRYTIFKWLLYFFILL
jgi:hypothetical protein